VVSQDRILTADQRLPTTVLYDFFIKFLPDIYIFFCKLLFEVPPMKEVLLEKPTVADTANAEISEPEQKSLSRWRATFFFGFIAGISSAATGLILGAVSYTGFFRNARVANQTGNLLIIAAFPLMMLGAHALDKINDIKRRQKENPKKISGK
jgi:cytochrome c biogenesis protein CcdA